MTWQPFILYNSEPKVRGFSCDAYRPLFIKQNGEKVRNPAFDNHSQQILNLKSPERPNYFNPAVKYCAARLLAFLKSNHQDESVEFLIIPSSTKGKTSLGLEKIVLAVCRTDKRFTYVEGSLFRHRTIDKLAKGGDRSLHVHLDSMDYSEKPGSPRVKILLDDVMTSGNSLTGAITVIRQVDARHLIVPLVFGKTTHD
ncbi:MAG: phosphoribosyltransferase [Pseudomonadota bacterium]